MSAITDLDVEFARAVVALARQHKMEGLSLEFKHSFNLSAETKSFEIKKMQWHSGRHGSSGTIRFTTQASSEFSEKGQMPDKLKNEGLKP